MKKITKRIKNLASNQMIFMEMAMPILKTSTKRKKTTIITIIRITITLMNSMMIMGIREIGGIMNKNFIMIEIKEKIISQKMILKIIFTKSKI